MIPRPDRPISDELAMMTFPTQIRSTGDAAIPPSSRPLSPLSSADYDTFHNFFTSKTTLGTSLRKSSADGRHAGLTWVALLIQLHFLYNQMILVHYGSDSL
jgi:hypothetical protein